MPKPRIPEFDAVNYDVAVLTSLASALASHVPAQRRFVFDREHWLRAGDAACAERIARDLGWRDPMPPPFAMASARRFDLRPGTVVLHPGCKPNWQWKRWHGFAELAATLPRVAIVGTAEDRTNASTYFRAQHAWPAHATDYTGALSLPDTAALIAQAAALVSNDSGLMHLGVAVGTPTFGIFGITNPAREIIPAPHMHVISKGLQCEPACRAQPQGRHDCVHHLQCLKELTVDEIVGRLRPHLPTRPRVAEPITAAVRLEGGIGDIVLAGRFIEGLFRALGHCDLDVFHQDQVAARFVFHEARYVRAIHPPNAFRASAYDLSASALQFVHYDVRDWVKLDRVRPEAAAQLREAAVRFASWRGLYDKRPSLDGLWGRLSVRAGRTVASNLEYLSGLKLPYITALAPDPAEYQKIRSSVDLLSGAYVTVHDGFDNSTTIKPGEATKCWPLAHWKELVSALKAEFPSIAVVQVGGARSREIPGVDVSLVRRTSLHQVAWVIKRALLHIDGDSGLVHLAHALGKRSIVMFGPTDAKYYGYPGNRNLAVGACGNCWWSTPDWLAHCPRGLAEPACMAAVGPDAVLAAVRPFLVRSNAGGIVGARSLFGPSLVAEDSRGLASLFSDAGLVAVPITEHAVDTKCGAFLHASKQWEYLFVLRHLPAREGPLRIADVGGGRGALAVHLAARGHAVEVFDRDYLWDHGGDPDVERRYVEWVSSRGVRVRFASAYALPAEDACFDAVLCVSVVEHVRFKALLLEELLRVLRPGGVLIITFDFAAAPERFQDELRVEIFGPESLDALLAEVGVAPAGFTLAEIDDSVAAIVHAGVAGIPAGMTVGGIVIQKKGDILPVL